MPVTLLLCEGVRESPDARVLNRLLGRYCTVEPIGSKYGMDAQILVRRDVSPFTTVMGLKDADFYRDWLRPSDTPDPWSKRVAGGLPVRLGWSWARNEIENYLIDPIVVARALGTKAPLPNVYQETLDRAANEISDYTAARTALSLCRLKVKQLQNKWGTPRGHDRHLFPEALARSSCRKEIKRIVKRQTQGALPEPRQVVAEFRKQLPSHGSTGTRRAHYLHTYAGKDLLVQMDGDLKQLGFGNFGDFRERVLIGIRDAPDDIANWLPEWNSLRNEVQTFMP